MNRNNAHLRHIVSVLLATMVCYSFFWANFTNADTFKHRCQTDENASVAARLRHWGTHCADWLQNAFSVSNHKPETSQSIAEAGLVTGCPGLVPLSRLGWSLKYVDSEEKVAETYLGLATNAFDGNLNTFWHTKWYGGNDPMPHEIQIDLGAGRAIGGFRYLPRQDGSPNGRIANYQFYVSSDGVNWGSPVASGTWTYSNANAKEVQFAFTTARYIRLRATSEVNGNPWTSAAEIDVLICANEVCGNGLDDDNDGFADDFDPECTPPGMEVIPAGSYIINMGVQPQTVNTALKPYGLVWRLLHDHQVPVVWSINPNKDKDGVDFTYNGTPFKGGPFIVKAAFRSAAVNSLISAWEAQGVIGVTTNQHLLVPINRTITYSMNWTLNLKNGDIAKAYLDRAGIPESAYNWTLPENLDCCNDVFLMPHSEPTWATHNYLLNWNASEAQGGCAGALWAGCKAGSEVENIFNPANPSQRMNFLMLNPLSPATNPAVWSGNHADGTIPPPYTYGQHAHPIMQFLGTLDGAQENGAEQIYLPTNGWRPTSLVGVWDATHPNVPSLSPGLAAKVAFGPAFGDTSRGYIMYQAAHRLDKAAGPANIAAQRAFFNFSFMAAGQKAIKVATNVLTIMETGTVYDLTASATGGNGSYQFKWTSTCGGTFGNPFSANTTFTPPDVNSPTPCIVKVEVTDGCASRLGYDANDVRIEPRPAPPVAVDDNGITQPGTPITLNALYNDYDPNNDPLTFTGFIGATNTGNGIFVNNGGGSVTYTPDYDFIGTDQIQYRVCDPTPANQGGPLCDTAFIRIVVDWIDEHGCYPNQYYGVLTQGYADAVVAENSMTNPSQALGEPVLVASSNSYYAKIDNNSDYMVVDLTDTVPAGDTIWIYFGTDDGASGELQVQGTLNSTNYSTGSGFYDLQAYVSVKDLNDASPQQDTVPYIPTTGPVRYLRFTRVLGKGKPSVNGVFYTVNGCKSAVPVAVNDAATVCEDNLININVKANDSDPQNLPLTVSIATPPVHGTAIVKANGTVNYQPNADYSGADNFVYKVCNPNNLCAQATVAITITDDACPAGQYKASSYTPYIYGFQGGNSTTFKRYNVANNTWTTLASAPAAVDIGGALAFDGTYIYGFRSNNTNTFWRYNITSNSWTAMANAPANVGVGASLTYDGTHIYGFPGGGSNSFWRYNISTNTWTVLASPPKGFKQGASIVFDGTYLYATRGDNHKEFYRYNIATNKWASLAPALQNVEKGAALVFDGDYIYGTRGNNHEYFWRYDIGANAWAYLAPAPAGINDRAALAFDGTYIYATAAGGSTSFWRYDIHTNTWASKAGSTFGTGGALVVTTGPASCIGSCVPIPTYPPDAVNDEATTVSGVTVSIPVQSNDVDPSGLGLTTYLGMSDPPDNGTVALIGKKIDYTPDTYFTGVDTFNYKICNAYGCDSALVIVKVWCALPGGGNAIQGVVFNDHNVNTLLENSEHGLDNVKVLLYADKNANGLLDPGDEKIDSVFTDANGIYALQSLAAGSGGGGGGGSGGGSIMKVKFSKRISNGNDDAEEEGPNGVNLGPGGMYLASSDLELTQDFQSPSSGTQKIGLRFTGITIPNGATITGAYVDFLAEAADSPNTNNGTTNLLFKGQAIDNAPTFSTTTYNISNRAKTSSYVSWSPAAWTAGQVYSSPNLASVVQEIVNRPGWESGNSLALFIEGTGSRSATSHNGSTANAPLLRIEYEVEAESPDPALGTAFWSDGTTPEVNAWDGSNFGTTQNTVAAGDRARILAGAASPYRDEKIVVGIGTTGAVAGQMWNGASWANLPINPMGIVSETFWWGADVVYEQLSGDAIVVWNANPNLKYSVWNGTSWTTPATISTPISGEAKQIKLAGRPSSDEIVAVVSCTNGDYALVWNGSAWGNGVVLDNKPGNNDFTDVSVAYEHLTGRAMVAYGINGGGSSTYALYYRFWNGSAWTAESSLQPYPTIDVPSRAKWIVLDADRNSNRIVAGVQSAGADGWVSVWNGTSWGTPFLLTPSILVLDAGTAPNLAVAFERVSGDVLVTYGRSSQNVFFHRTWNSTNGWSSEVVNANVAANTNSMRLYPNAATDNMMLAIQNDAGALRYIRWTGSTWGTPITLSGNTSETKNQPFLFLWNQVPDLSSPGSNGYFIVKIDTTTLPPSSYLMTENIRTVSFSGSGAADCLNNFPVYPQLPPIANPDTVRMDQGTSVIINVIGNDSDPEGTPLTMTILTNPSNGTATNNQNGTLTYTPTPSFTGWLTFNYEICDQGTPTLCDTSTVTVIVDPFINTRPEAQDDYDTTTVNNDVTTSVLDNDFDQEFGVLTVSLPPGLLQPANGTVAVVNAKKITYTPAPQFTGNDSYQYKVCDDESPSLCDTAKVFIHVKNNPPDARDDGAITSTNVGIPIYVLLNDVEPDGHGIVLMSAGTNALNGATVKGGTATLNTNGTPSIYTDDYIAYIPPSGFAGVDSFYYKIRDTGTPNGFDIALVTIRVTALIDLELQKTVNPATTSVNQNVTFTLTLTNKGPATATGIKVKDKLPSSFQYISNNGGGAYDPVSGIWYRASLGPNQSVTLTITAKVLNRSQLKNVTEVIAANEKDTDSTPNNDDGDQSEDDEDAATVALVEICGNGLDDDDDGLSDCADSDCRPTPNAGQDVTICQTGTATLVATATGGGGSPFTYDWSHGLGSGQTKNVSPPGNTTYNVTVTGSNGCTATDQVTVFKIDCPEECTNGLDDDGDGYVDCADYDCYSIGAPLPNNDVYATCPGSSFTEQVIFNDVNLQSPVYTIYSQPSKGSVNMQSNGVFTYTPYNNDCTTDQFVYQVCNQVMGCCATATVTLNIGDNIPPVLTNVPADVTISCDDIVPTPPTIIGLDACPGIYISMDEVSTYNPGVCENYTITRTWTATDLCGNSSTQSQVITVQDAEPPELFRVYTLPSGKRIAAGIAKKVTKAWKQVPFPVTFSKTPLVFSQVVSDANAQAVIVRQRNITKEGFELRLQAEENSSASLQNESVAWIAIVPDSLPGQNNLQAGLLTNVTQALKTLNFSPAFASAPTFLAAAQTTSDNDPAAVRYTNRTNSSVQVFMEEEKSKDTEVAHGNEAVAYFAINAGVDLSDNQNGFIAKTGTISINNAWQTVTLNRKFNKPVVVFGGLSLANNEPATIRVRNVTSNSFQVRLQEWDYLDGAHPNETVSYIAMEGSLPAQPGIYCSNGLQDYQPGVNVFTVDNCDNQVNLTYQDESQFTSYGLRITRTWMATDICGNTLQAVTSDTCSIAAVRLKAIIHGAMLNNGGGSLMRDDLRKQGLIPLTEPYSAIGGYHHKGSGGGEAISQSTLNTTGNNAIVDWVFVEIRNPNEPTSVLTTQAALLQRDGDIVRVNGDTVIYFPELSEGNYYVSLRHRNHLGVMTDDLWHLKSIGPPLIDFRSATLPVNGAGEGGNMVNTSRVLWAGDLNGDRSAIYQGPNNDIFNLFSKVLSDDNNVDFLANFIGIGYAREDLNLDGKVIYQGPNNDRAAVLYHSVLAHPANVSLLANFIVKEKMP